MIQPQLSRWRSCSAATRALDLPHVRMLSSAGHDAGPIQSKFPAGMIFEPNEGGVTHNETEFTHPEDLTKGTKVLADVL